MDEQTVSKISLCGNSLLFFILGLILIMVPNKSLAFFHLTISTIIIILGVASTILNAFRKKSFQNTCFSIILFIIGIYFLYNPTNFLSIFPLVFALYIVLIGVIKFSTFCVYKSNGFKGFHSILLNSILELLFAYLVFINPIESIKPLTIILGFYFIFISFGYFIDFLEEAFPNNFLTKRRKFRITLPNILSLFIPYAFYRKINNSLNNEVTNVKIDKNTSGEVDLEIFIGVKESSIGKFGHADLCFDNKIYSYGHYDEDSKRFFDTIGDGTLFIVNNRDMYLKFCAEHSKKTIFAFGITLTNKQKENIKNELDKILANTYRWKCIQEIDKEKEYGDYASCLYRKTKAKFFKFNKSSYKLYYALWANCVKLVDHILRTSGSDVLRMNGVITPGAYYHHLNNQFKKKNSNVIRKEIITNSDIITQNKK